MNAKINDIKNVKRKTDTTTRRKLKRRNKTHRIDSQPESHIILKDTKPKKIPKKIIKKYKKQKCAFVYADGHQCKNNAVGKSTLCKKHGGSPIIKENLLVGIEEKALVDPNNKFDASYHPIEYINLSRNGLSAVEIAAMFEVTPDTINNWAEKFESFNTAFEVGKAMHEAWWLREGKNNLSTRTYNTNLYKFLAMNKLGYSDKIEQKSMNMNVHGVLVIPDKVTPDEWESEEVIDVN